MISRYGVLGTEADGIFFCETEIPGASRIQRVQCEISRQNSNLTQVKSELARQAAAAGADAIANFEYGQKAHSPLSQIFSFKWDTESWHGCGDAVKVTGR